MEDNKLPFKISSGLKNIIGRDLITDDYIAVFELVKNALDAYARKVTITFEEDRITIEDDGKGMNLDDIKNKWLFVAYSAKKEGTEDDELEDEKFKSYRDQIKLKKYYAGAKGIGRFSCDRLGSSLRLTTKKPAKDSSIEQIEINWNEFEKDPEKEFISINVNHRTLTSVPKRFRDFENGTILEISQLNTETTWNRQKKLNLKHSLEKLINPFEIKNENSFTIILKDIAELENDKDVKDKRQKVNGAVKNFVFEELGLKTTQIITVIDKNGDYITTSLMDRGVEVYKIRKKNDTEPQLKDIMFHLFHLNRLAKRNFKTLMGIDSVNFGSVFLYKNRIRIAPYGDYGNDDLGLDSRKAQKHFDYLGSRDLIGRIEIQGDNPNFKETSSRDGGLVRNEYYFTMLNCFKTQGLKKLESYLKKVQWKSKEDKDRDDLSALNNIESKSALIELIQKEIDDKDVELLNIDKTNIDLRINELLKEASIKDIEVLKNIAAKFGNNQFIKETNGLEKEHLKILELQKILAKEEENKLKLQEQLAIEREKNTYLRTSDRSLSEDAKGLVHNIKITSRKIVSNVDTLYEKILNDKVKQDEILKRLAVIKFNSEKALNISMLITRSNFRSNKNEQEVDLVLYILQYIDIYCKIYEKEDLDFDFINHEATLIKKVSVLDISVILDNLISNAEKADARKIFIELSNSINGSLNIIFSDNGKGIPKKFLDKPEQIFDLGVTTTDGSGIGLNSIRTALISMNGSIKFLGNGIKLKGACFQMVII